MELEDYTAHGVAYTVVAAKQGNRVVRAIGRWVKAEDLVEDVFRYVGTLNMEEWVWTTHTYHVPSYWAYPEGDLATLGEWPVGVFLFEKGSLPVRLGNLGHEPTAKVTFLGGYRDPEMER